MIASIVTKDFFKCLKKIHCEVQGNERNYNIAWLIIFINTKLLMWRFILIKFCKCYKLSISNLLIIRLLILYMCYIFSYPQPLAGGHPPCSQITNKEMLMLQQVIYVKGMMTYEWRCRSMGLIKERELQSIRLKNKYK